MESIKINESLQTPVKIESDVLVCGGGFAGVAAALSARRQGKKVVLIEKNYILGGLGTSGLVTIYLPLCDGFGNQVSFGIAEELLRISIREFCENDYPDNWLDSDDKSKRTEKDKRFQAVFNANMCAILLEKQLLLEGVEILYGTYAVSTIRSEDSISHVIIENKDGRNAVKVRSVVDATGDADIAYISGVPCKTFNQGNVLASWYYGYCKEKGYHCNMLGYADIPDEDKKNGKAVDYLSDVRFTGLDQRDITKNMIMSHNVIFNDVIKKRKSDKSYIPATIPTIPELRMTRKIVGEYELSDNEVGKSFDSSIGIISNWRKRGPIYEVPYETLFSKKCRNLICCGRCTSVTEAMWDIMRVIPCCAVTGQAAGTAAALTDDFLSLNIDILQEKLIENGVVLHITDLKN